MGLSQKEKAIQEKRTLEAIKRNLMGPSGKIGLIVQTLGHPIIRQGGGLYDVNYLDNFDDSVETEFETTASGQLGPMMSKDELLESADLHIEEQGYVFDGLNRGMHIEVHYWYNNQQIDVNYRGYLVYKELIGELLTYAPFPEWEQMIDTLYKIAKDKAKGMKLLQESVLNEKIKKEKHTFWTRLLHRWGV